MIQRMTGYHECVACFKRELIIQALAAHGGNRSHTAEALGLQRTYLLKLMRNFGIGVPRRKAPTSIIDKKPTSKEVHKVS